MTEWTDLFLVMPLPQNWLHGLLFIAFGLHLLFVLLMLGTALLGIVFFLEKWLDNNASQAWNKHLVQSHLGLKSLAVVLGVAPLLIIQVRYSHAFFTATALFSYAWLAVIPLLIGAFLLIDVFVHKMEGETWLAFFCGVLGVGALLTVPAIFTGALALAERQDIWSLFAANGFSLEAAFARHWLLRYLHILGAAFVFGAAFHIFFSTRGHPEKMPRLRRWLVGGILAQIVIGIPLLFTVNADLNWPVVGAVTVGAAAAMLALWVLRAAPASYVARGPRGLLVLLPLVFVSMLVARQALQDEAVTPGHAVAMEARRARSEALTPYRGQSLEVFSEKLATVYNNGKTIYAGACAPCHGATGRGDGQAARRLLIPAEDIAAIRADRDYVYDILKDGTPGSAMPYFRLYDREKLESLLDTLSQEFDMFSASAKPARHAGDEAKGVWAATCSVCHGMDGAISSFGKTLLPAPPDLRVYSLTPERALTVITEGYPGTAMVPFRALSKTVREDLAGISNSFRAVAP